MDKLDTEGLLRSAKDELKRCEVNDESAKTLQACRGVAEKAWGYMFASARKELISDEDYEKIPTQDRTRAVGARVRRLDQRLSNDYSDIRDALHGDCFYDGRIMACGIAQVRAGVTGAEEWVTRMKRLALTKRKGW